MAKKNPNKNKQKKSAENTAKSGHSSKLPRTVSLQQAVESINYTNTDIFKWMDHSSITCSCETDNLNGYVVLKIEVSAKPKNSETEECLKIRHFASADPRTYVCINFNRWVIRTLQEISAYIQRHANIECNVMDPTAGIYQL